MDPKGKVALVTGGANGIGLAIIQQLLQEGVKGVAVCDVNPQLGEQRLVELEEKYGKDRGIYIKTDVRDFQQLQDAFKQTKEKFGELNIVVNNAGIFDDVQWETEVDINFNGVIRGLMLSFDHMGKRCGSDEPAVVVNIASITGLEPIDIFPIYSGIKHGIVGLTRAFGTDLNFERTGVRVVAICPGYTSTNIGQKEGLLIDPSWTDKFIASNYIFQQADYVGRGVVKIIKEAPNGSLWVSELEETYQAVIPPRLSMRTSQSHSSP